MDLKYIPKAMGGSADDEELENIGKEPTETQALQEVVMEENAKRKQEGKPTVLEELEQADRARLYKDSAADENGTGNKEKSVSGMNDYAYAPPPASAAAIGIADASEKVDDTSAFDPEVLDALRSLDRSICYVKNERALAQQDGNLEQCNSDAMYKKHTHITGSDSGEDHHSSTRHRLCCCVCMR